MTNIRITAREGSLVLTSKDENFFNYNHYPDKIKACDITNEYLSGLTCLNNGFIDDVNRAVRDNTTCDGLDFALYALFQQNASQNFSRGVGRDSLDEDEGFLNIARKHHEETTTHDSLLVP